MAVGVKYSIGPLSLFAPEEQLREWLNNASKDHRSKYAEGPALAGHPTARLAGDAARNGVNGKRFQLESEPCERGRRYFIRCTRSAGDPSTRACGAAQGERVSDGLHVDAVKLFAMLSLAAEEGAACPTNEELAERLGLGSHEQARHRFRQLEQAGMIRTVTRHRFGRRVVEICGSGKKTGPLDTHPGPATSGAARPNGRPQAPRSASGGNSVEDAGADAPAEFKQ